MIGNGEPEMVSVSGTTSEVHFVSRADHDAALKTMGGVITSEASVLVAPHPDQSTGIMISIYLPEIGIMTAFLDQQGLEIIADQILGLVPAPAGETIQ